MKRKGNNPTNNSLFQFFLHELDDLYNAEFQILRELPMIAKKATNNDLKEALRDHYNETKTQVERLQSIYDILGERPQEITCVGMQGILQEGSETISECPNAAVRDVAIISAAQKVEHYEITSYGSVRAHAQELGFDEVVDLLQETLEEEAAADKKLTKIAEGSFFSAGINKQALDLETAGSTKRK